MPRYLIIDTETSGLHVFPKRGEPPIPADAPGQPRMAAITMIPVNEALEPDGETISTLIQPDGWEITPEITAINGLTTEKCEREGVDVGSVLSAYQNFIREEHRVVVAFNAQFDTKILRGELRRAAMDDLFEQTLNICTMKAGMKLGVKKRGEKKGGFPKLSDVYYHFFETEPEGGHTSLGDANACLAIFRKLIEIGAAPEPSILYAKNHAA
jgi:DNA polymerase III subunit epsilon